MPWRAACKVACRLAEFRTIWAIILAADAVPLVPPSLSCGACMSRVAPRLPGATTQVNIHRKPQEFQSVSQYQTRTCGAYGPLYIVGL